MAGRLHVLVVGAGIVGASIAWHLARAGARVTVVEAGTPGGTATRRSLAWINASWGNAEPYFRLRVRAMAEWRRVAADLPGFPLAWCGGLLWDLPADRLRIFVAGHAAQGYPIRLVDRAEARRLEPQLADPPELSAHASGEGVVEPLAASEMLMAAARDHGATIVANTTVRALDRRDGRIAGVETAAGRIAADRVVLAAGAAAPAIAATAGLALAVDARPALLIAAGAVGRLLNGLVLAPAFHARQASDGRIFASASVRSGDTATECRALFDALDRMLGSPHGLQLEEATAAVRPIPTAGQPLVGTDDRAPGLYVAVMHSAVTLAPAIGSFVADELLTGRRDPLLAPFGLPA